MIDMFLGIVAESWNVLVEASPYVLFGFFVAGLLKGFVPDSSMARHLGGNSFGSVLKAAVIGVAASPVFVRSAAHGSRPSAAGGEQGRYHGIHDFHPGNGCGFHGRDLCAHRPDHDGHPACGRVPDGSVRRDAGQRLSRQGRIPADAGRGRQLRCGRLRLRRIVRVRTKDRVLRPVPHGHGTMPLTR